MTRCTSRTFAFALLLLGTSLSLPGFAQLPPPVFPAPDAWTALTPAELGMDAARLAEAQAYAETRQGAGLIARRGYKVHEWGNQTFRFHVFSVTKGIGALLLGVAVDDRAVAVGDRAQTHFPAIGLPENANSPDWLAAITLEHLATHSSGFKEPRGAPTMGAAPGTRWTYSDGGANWLADTLTFRLNEDLREVLALRILGPLGITVRRVEGESGDLFWRDNTSRDPMLNGIRRREFNSGISLNVDAMARIGLLVESGGEWNGVRILSQEYLTRMAQTAAVISGLPIVDGNGASLDADFPNVTEHHGLLWFNNADATMPDVPRDTFWTWGAGDHLIVVIPSLDLVVARTSGQALDGSASAPWDRQCLAGSWCARYEVLAPFLTPIAQSVQAAPPPGAPTVTLTSSAAGVTVGGSAVLTWSSTLADSCTASNGWTGAKATSGTETVTVSQTATYVLECTGAGGTTQSSVSITANPAPAPDPPPADEGGGGGALQWWMLAALFLVGGGRRALRISAALRAPGPSRHRACSMG